VLRWRRLIRITTVTIITITTHTEAGEHRRLPAHKRSIFVMRKVVLTMLRLFPAFFNREGGWGFNVMDCAAM